MDFVSLLNVAQKNEQKPKNEFKYYSTKFEPPKKEERSKQLSVNIKKFLARKEAEEKQKALEAKLEKEKLLALRSQDKKSQRRVQVMLKRTKSANKAVIQDAVDNDNTAVTLAGPSQPDEDDYGYVSQEASAYYNKIMAKYSNMPDEPKFPSPKKNTNTNLSGTKDRVRQALLKEQEEALLPHRRKRKHKESETNESQCEPEEPAQQEKSSAKPAPKPKPKVAAPPPMNFAELLKIAEKKQFEPVKIEPKKEPKEDERPMTKKQKKEFEKEQAWRERKEKGLTNNNPPQKPADKPTQTTQPPNKIPKLSNVNNSIKNSKMPNVDDRNKPAQKPQVPTSNMKKGSERPQNGERSHNGMQNYNSVPRKIDPSKLPKPRPEAREQRESNHKMLPPKPYTNQTNSRPSEKAQTIHKSYPKGNPLDRNKNIKKEVSFKEVKPPSLQSSEKSKQLPQMKPKQFPPADMKSRNVPVKQLPPKELKPKQFPPPDVRPKQFPPKDVRRKPPIGHKRRILDDDDDEYDSEMDDFIDDGPLDEEDYSKHISEIFGYDKSRYRDEDYEDDNMESSFSQVMKEEFISSKIGLLEDLEDIKKEAEEKKRKAMMKKARK